MQRATLARCLLLIGLLGCARSSPAAESGTSLPAAAAPLEQPKTITIAQLSTVKSYGPWDFSDTSGGAATLAEIHTIGLVSADAQGAPQARLAARIPSLDDGGVVMLPDGRMQTTWQLKAGVTWHDGQPFTADDVVFSWELLRAPGLVSPLSGIAQRMT